MANKGGQPYYRRQLAGEVRDLTLREIKAILVDKKNYKFMCMDDIDACIFSRIDIHEVNKDEFLMGKTKVNESFYEKGIHDGADGFFFTRKWWLHNNYRFHDDMILGDPYWDFYYRKIINVSTKKVFRAHSLYHIYHATTWNFESPGAVNNKNIWDNS